MEVPEFVTLQEMTSSWEQKKIAKNWQNKLLPK